MYDPNNQFEPGTAEYYTQKQANDAEARNAAQMRASGPMTFGRSLGPAIFWCGLFVVAVFGSTSAFKALGHSVLIGSVALLGVAIAVAGDAFLGRPLLRLTGWSWRSNALARSVMVGAGLGIGVGAWLGYSHHELVRGIARLGTMGAVIGLIFGVVLLLVARASRRLAR